MPSRWNAPLPTASASLADPQRDLRGSLHEVANALTVVVGWLERACDDPALPSEARRAVDIALARALDGRFVARRAIGADVEPSAAEEALDELLDEAVTGALPMAEAKQVALRCEASTGSWLVDDARQALQVVTNLLFNAIAFSPDAASVVIEARPDGDDIVIVVTDEGPGVPEDRRRGLFSAASGSTRQGGAGVGLAHSRALARMHGGELALLDTQRGAAFELRWPRAAERSRRAVAARASDGLDGQRVLIVEDDPAVLVLLETALGNRGIEVVCARDLTEIAAATEAAAFDAALIDLSPLGGAGAEIVAGLRDRNPDVRIVLISGNAAPPSEIVSACAAWVRKPFDLAEITNALAFARKSA